MFGWKCLKIDWGIFVLSKNDGGQLVMVVLFYKKKEVSNKNVYAFILLSSFFKETSNDFINWNDDIVWL